MHQQFPADSNYRILLQELRGHGKSDRSEAYTKAHFVLDLMHVAASLEIETFALFGHSLGGHIACRYAALFPEQVKALMVVEGLGPPRRPGLSDDKAKVDRYRDMMLSRLVRKPSRPVPSVAEVNQRLQANNPRMTSGAAEHLAPHMVVERHGSLFWNFDSAANSVFLGTSEEDNEVFWRSIQAPTLLISGTLSYQYWGQQMGWDGHFAEGEMEARAAQFQHADHHWFENSGHMVHYDEPERLGQLIAKFLEQNYV